MRLDPRFVAIALALFAAGLGAVGALATRPAIPPSISRPVVKAIVATVRIVNPPPTTREIQAWPPRITFRTSPPGTRPSLTPGTRTHTATRAPATSSTRTSSASPRTMTTATTRTSTTPTTTPTTPPTTATTIPPSSETTEVPTTTVLEDPLPSLPTLPELSP